MFRSRGVTVLFIIMSLLIIGSVAAFFVMNGMISAQEDVTDPDIDQIVNDLTVETGEVTTNIKGDHFIKVNFNIQVSNKRSRDELQKRAFQVKNAIIYTVSGMTPEKLQDQKGIENLEVLIKNRINDFLDHGHVTHVYTTEKIVQ